MDDVIDDIISLESSFNDDIITLIDSGLQLPSTVRRTAHLLNRVHFLFNINVFFGDEM